LEYFTGEGGETQKKKNIFFFFKSAFEKTFSKKTLFQDIILALEGLGELGIFKVFMKQKIK
jgi:hypothetical protein